MSCLKPSETRCLSLQNFDLDLIADVDEILGMGETSPGHIGDVQQAIESPEIDKGAVLGQILDHPGEHRTFFQMLQSFGALLGLLAFQQFLARDHDVAALFVQLDHGHFDGLALHRIQIADGAQIHLGSREKRMRAVNVDGESTLDAVEHDSMDGLLLVIRFLDFFPGVNALRFLVREVDVAFLGFPLAAHDVDRIAGLELGLALVVEHFRQRQHAFRFRANIHDHVGGGQLQDRTLDHAIFADGLFGLAGEGLESRGEILVGGGFVFRRGRARGGSLGLGLLAGGLLRLLLFGSRLFGSLLFRSLLFGSRGFFCHDVGVGIGVMVGGGVVEQDYASLVIGCGNCSRDCWRSRLVVVGPPWRVSLDNPSCRTFNKEPASNGNSSTIAIVREQCQT